jgi:hypothetical protein
MAVAPRPQLTDDMADHMNAFQVAQQPRSTLDHG